MVFFSWRSSARRFLKTTKPKAACQWTSLTTSGPCSACFGGACTQVTSRYSSSHGRFHLDWTAVMALVARKRTSLATLPSLLCSPHFSLRSCFQTKVTCNWPDNLKSSHVLYTFVISKIISCRILWRYSYVWHNRNNSAISVLSEYSGILVLFFFPTMAEVFRLCLTESTYSTTCLIKFLRWCRALRE